MLQTFYGASQILFGVELFRSRAANGDLLGRNGMGKTTTIRFDFGPDSMPVRQHPLSEPERGATPCGRGRTHGNRIGAGGTRFFRTCPCAKI